MKRAMPPPRRSAAFRRPWRLEEHNESFGIKSDAGTVLALVYWEDEPGRRAVTNRLTREEAHRLAAQITKLPELLEELKRWRAGSGND
jgi:hypothetical protein